MRSELSANLKKTVAQNLRVVQWTSGRIGKQSLRAIIEHPSLALVGVFAHSEEKIHRDAGELCGLPPTGIVATDNMGEILALGADCILYMPRQPNIDELCQLLASGSNVVMVTSQGDLFRPESMEPQVREKLERACQCGSSSLHSTGSSPGFITEAVPLVLTSLQRRLDCLTIDEFGDLSGYNSAAMVFDTLGFGLMPHAFECEARAHGREVFGPSLALLADALSIPLESVEQSVETATALKDVEIAAGKLKAGSVAAQRVTVSGMRNGKAVLQFRLCWYCTRELDKDWTLNNSGWHISVKGDTPLEVDIGIPLSMEQLATVGPAMAAHRAVNSVHALMAAPPGIVSSFDLSPVAAILR